MLIVRLFLSLASIFAGLSVGLGAFASHALREKLTERALEIFETGAKYQMYHSLALLGVAILLNRGETSQSFLIASGFAFITGIVLFSGSLYFLSLTDIKGLGVVTPLGGVAFLVGWICLAIAAFSFK